MNEQLLTRLGSPLREIFEEVRCLRKQGREIHDFTVGEPTWPVRAGILARVASRIEASPCSPYPPAQGLPELREAVADEFAARTGCSVDASSVVITNGAKQAIWAAMRAALKPGDGVAIFSPYYPSYVAHAHLAGARPVLVATDERGLPDLDDLSRKVDGACRMIVVNTPCNPTGAVWPPESLAGVVRLAVERRCVILSDECYRGFVYDGARHVSPAGMAGTEELLVTVDSFSKSHAMAGWRLGCAVGYPAMVKAMALLVGEATSGVNTVAQWAGLEALQAQCGIEEVRATLARNRDVLYRALSVIEGVDVRLPGGAFYHFPTVTGLCSRLGCADTTALVRRMLARGVAATPGSAFGAPDAVRFSFCQVGEGFDRAVDALEEALE